MEEKDMFNEYNELPENLVETGSILKSNEVDLIIPNTNIKGIVSRLILSPGAKIKYHMHTKDSEFYILYNDNNHILFCPKGNGHSLENTSDEILEVLSVKFVDSE